MSYNELKQHGTADFPIELYHIDKNHPKYEMASHWHNQLEIIRVIDGTMNIRLNNNVYIAKKDDIIIVNPETVHGAYFTSDCTYECIVMHLDMLIVDDTACKFFVDSVLNREFVLNEFNPKNQHSPSFHNSVNNLFESLHHKSSGYKFAVIGALYQLLGTIVDEHMYSPTSIGGDIPDDKNLTRLKNVLFYIRTNYHRQITLDDMAECAGMSPKYFCYFFRDMTRKTPIEYLISYRIERAARKLLNSDMSVTEIALSCGFNDLSYFIKTFKNLKGTTPSKFRKS